MVIEVCPSLPEFLNKDKPIIVVVGWIKKENKNGEEGEDELSQAADEVVYKFKNLFDEFVSRTAVQIDGVHPVMYTPAYLEVNGRDFGVIAGHHESDDDARDVKFDIEIKPNDQSRVMKYFYPENIWRKVLLSSPSRFPNPHHPPNSFPSYLLSLLLSHQHCYPSIFRIYFLWQGLSTMRITQLFQSN